VTGGTFEIDPRATRVRLFRARRRLRALLELDDEQLATRLLSDRGPA
jgi:hypothetical protein